MPLPRPNPALTSAVPGPSAPTNDEVEQEDILGFGAIVTGFIFNYLATRLLTLELFCVKSIKCLANYQTFG